jgi:hypothetical protein
MAARIYTQGTQQVKARDIVPILIKYTAIKSLGVLQFPLSLQMKCLLQGLQRLIHTNHLCFDPIKTEKAPRVRGWFC